MKLPGRHTLFSGTHQQEEHLYMRSFDGGTAFSVSKALTTFKLVDILLVFYTPTNCSSLCVAVACEYSLAYCADISKRHVVEEQQLTASRSCR